jgi:low temperature requirement protein LtrA
VWGLNMVDLASLLGVKPCAPDAGSDAYRVPVQRHEFNQAQEPLHAQWSDLFLDLIFVGAGYRLGGLMKDAFYSCGGLGGGGGVGTGGSYGGGGGGGGGGTSNECVGLGLGLLYFVAIFQVLYRCWLTDMLHTARYESEDRYHRLLDLGSYLLLCLAANAITSVQTLVCGSLPSFLVPVMLVMGLWILRFVEMALFSPGEVTRRRASGDIIDHGQSLLIYALAILLLSPYAARRGLDQSPGSAASVLSPVLMLVGGLWYELRLLFRLQRPYCCLSPGAQRQLRRQWPVSRMVVPHNIGFAIHRFNEFMMLMLGETLLQLVITDFGSESRLAYYGLTIGGFVVCLCMMYSFHVSEPHHHHEHVLMRASQARPASRARRLWTLAGIVYMGALMSLKSAFVLLTGVGIKIAAADPSADPHTRTARDARLQLGWALLLCFGMNLVMSPLHSPNGIFYYYASLLRRKSRERACVALLRLVLCGCHLAVASVPLVPLHAVLLQAGLSCAQVGLIGRERLAGLRDGSLEASTGHDGHGDSDGHGHGHGRRSRRSSIGGGRMSYSTQDKRRLVMFDTFGALPVAGVAQDMEPGVVATWNGSSSTTLAGASAGGGADAVAAAARAAAPGTAWMAAAAAGLPRSSAVAAAAALPKAQNRMAAQKEKLRGKEDVGQKPTTLFFGGGAGGQPGRRPIQV